MGDINLYQVDRGAYKYTQLQTHNLSRLFSLISSFCSFRSIFLQNSITSRSRNFDFSRGSPRSECTLFLSSSHKSSFFILVRGIYASARYPSLSSVKKKNKLNQSDVYATTSHFCCASARWY